MAILRAFTLRQNQFHYKKKVNLKLNTLLVLCVVYINYFFKELKCFKQKRTLFSTLSEIIVSRSKK